MHHTGYNPNDRVSHDQKDNEVRPFSPHYPGISIERLGPPAAAFRIDTQFGGSFRLLSRPVIERRVGRSRKDLAEGVTFAVHSQSFANSIKEELGIGPDRRQFTADQRQRPLADSFSSQPGSSPTESLVALLEQTAPGGFDADRVEIGVVGIVVGADQGITKNTRRRYWPSTIRPAR